MVSRLALALLLVHCVADGARLGEVVSDGLPMFSRIPCEADMCVLVTYSDGSSDILETYQDTFNGEKVNVFKGKALSTGKKAVIIPRCDSEMNQEQEETIVFKTLKAGGCTRFSVDLINKGDTECLNNAQHPTEERDEVEDIDLHLDFSEDSRMELAPKALDPNGYKLKVVVYYDDVFAEEFKAKSVTRVKAIMAIVDEMYEEIDTLTTKIDIIVVDIEHAQGENWGFTNNSMDIICQKGKHGFQKDCPATEIALKSKHNVDLYVFLTGSDSKFAGGRGNVGSLCSTNRGSRLSISKYSVDNMGKKSSDAFTAEIVAHEIGHNLGMRHDCKDNNCNYWDANYKGPRKLDGVDCYGYMDYNVTTNYWSPCSVFDFTSYMNQHQVFCLEQIKPTDENTGQKVCNNIMLNTRTENRWEEGNEIVWAFGSCLSQQTYKSNTIYNVECCQPEGEYELRCIDKQKDGWAGAYIQIGDSKTKYCEDFKAEYGAGDLQVHKVRHEAAASKLVSLNMKLTTKKDAHEISWDFGSCSSNGEKYMNYNKYELPTCDLPAGNHVLNCKDSYGNGWHGGFLEIAGIKYCEDFLKGGEKTQTVTIK